MQDNDVENMLPHPYVKTLKLQVWRIYTYTNTYFHNVQALNGIARLYPKHSILEWWTSDLLFHGKLNILNGWLIDEASPLCPKISPISFIW